MSKLVPLIAVILLTLACAALPGTPTATPVPGAACELVANESTTIYMRPSAAADVFSTLGSGERVDVRFKTADGFYSFDPGVAQAGNVGLFRERWILKSHQVSLVGDCAAVPVVVAPIAGICYAMIMADTPVYSNPDTASSVLEDLVVGDYAMAIGTSLGWVQVDLDVSSLMTEGTGWVQDSQIGYNGSCP